MEIKENENKKLLDSLPNISLQQSPANTDAQTSRIPPSAIEHANTEDCTTNIQQKTAEIDQKPQKLY